MSLLPQPLQFSWAQLPLGHLFLPSESCPWALLPPPFLFPPLLSQLSLLPVDIFPVLKGMEFQCLLLEAFPNPF